MNTQTENIDLPKTEGNAIAAATNDPATSKKMIWAGRIMSALPVLLLLFSGIIKLVNPPSMAEGLKHLGLPEQLMFGIGLVELACTIIYIIPQTAVLGAILLTGYLGGAILTTLRVGDSWIMAALLGVLVWGGLYLRDPRLRALIPLRR
jgi:hypothetical protein